LEVTPIDRMNNTLNVARLHRINSGELMIFST
jgi:hypothetical protein